MKRVNGFTLVELLVTVSLLSILLVVAVPALSSWLQRQRSTTLQYSLIHSIHYTRAQSASLQATVTLCPGTTNCEAIWGSKLLVFSDQDSDGLLDDSDLLLKRIDLGKVAGELDWRSFRNKAYLQFNARGLTNALNGTFTFCPASANNPYGFSIAVASTGRVRFKEPDC